VTRWAAGNGRPYRDHRRPVLAADLNEGKEYDSPCILAGLNMVATRLTPGDHADDNSISSEAPEQACERGDHGHCARAHCQQGPEESRVDATRREALLREYSEVGANFRLLTDIRFKLLALLPIAAAAAAALKGDPLGIQGFGLSLFGLVATLGLATYNARNDQLYDELVGRAASVERSLGLPDGYFANRPRPWLYVPLGNFRWSIDHRIGVTTIYAASVALWASGVLAPILDFARRVYPLLGLSRFAVEDPTLVVNILASILAIALTVLGIVVIGKNKKRRAKQLRAWAVEAVKTAAGLQVGRLAECKDLLLLCEKLSGEKRETIRSRAQFYAKLDAESLGHYVPSGSQEVTAAHIVALLTDLPARWLFDCATNRRGSVRATK